MSEVAAVRLWGRTIGAVSMGARDRAAAFQYDNEFVGSGIELSPLVMPLARRVYTFPQLAGATFHGLPGLLADSLPDRFGNALIDAWLAADGRARDSFTALERLCYTGSRGMGALEFQPTLGPETKSSVRVHVDQLVDLATRVLRERNTLSVSFSGEADAQALRHILAVGTSAGGARAKAVIAWNPTNNEVRCGQVPATDEFEYWLLKFDGVTGNRDKELADPLGYGAIEFAYAKMATDAGITMSACRLFEEHGRRHFMTRRFDRLASGGKLHMQSLAALAHFDFNMAGAYSYEQALLLMRRLDLPMSSIEQQFRRMAFNVIARNQDDHVKNIAFLMDRSGRWSLSPAFDVTWAFNPEGSGTSSHQMTINGQRDDVTLHDLEECARTASMKRGRAKSIVAEVCAAVSRWPDYADNASVPAAWRDRVEASLRTTAF